MKKIKSFIKKNYKLVIGIIIGGLVFGSIVYAETIFKSSDVEYDNTTSGLTSTNLQGAIDELNTKATTKIDEAKASCPDGYICLGSGIYNKCEIVSGTGANIGDEIKCGTESFYILDTDINSTTLFAKYNLDVGTNCGDNNCSSGLNSGYTYIQNEECTGNSGIYNGYSYEFTCTDWDNDNGYFSKYKNYLVSNVGFPNNIELSYMTPEILRKLGCDIDELDEEGILPYEANATCKNSPYSFLYSTRYFLSFQWFYSSSSKEFASMITNGSIALDLVAAGSGHRPVIKVPSVS